MINAPARQYFRFVTATSLPGLALRETWDPHFDAGNPAFAPLAAAMQPFRAATDWPSIADWNAAIAQRRLTVASGAPLSFVPQTRGPARRARRVLDLDSLYDERIHARGEVPSRARDWHDLFNMLVWCTFPRAKSAVNARQRAALRARIDPSARRLPAVRTREQDALAMLDEGSVLVVAPESDAQAAFEALVRCDLAAWRSLCDAGNARALLFGHALYEHLVRGHGTVRAMPVSLPLHCPLPASSDACIVAADEALAAQLYDPARFAQPGTVRAVPVVRAWFEADAGR